MAASSAAGRAGLEHSRRARCSATAVQRMLPRWPCSQRRATGRQAGLSIQARRSASSSAGTRSRHAEQLVGADAVKSPASFASNRAIPIQQGQRFLGAVSARRRSRECRIRTSRGGRAAPHARRPTARGTARSDSLSSTTERHSSRSSTSLRQRGVDESANWCRTCCSFSQPPKSRTRGVGHISRPASRCARSIASNSAAASSVIRARGRYGPRWRPQSSPVPRARSPWA